VKKVEGQDLTEKTITFVALLTLLSGLLIPVTNIGLSNAETRLQNRPQYNEVLSNFSQTSYSDDSPNFISGGIVSLYEVTSEELVTVTSYVDRVFISGMHLSFETQKTMHLHLIFSAAFWSQEGATIDIIAELNKTKNQFDTAPNDPGFGNNAEPWDCRTAQWIRRDLSAGDYEIDLWARIAENHTGVIGNRSMTLAVIDPSISPPNWIGVVDPDGVDFNTIELSEFWEISDVGVSFETNAFKDVQVIFSNTVFAVGDCTVEFKPLVDGTLEIAGEAWNFGSNMPAFDYRSAQWILKDLPAGHHNITILANVTGNIGRIAYSTLTISLTDQVPSNKSLSSSALWCGDSVRDQVYIDDNFFKEIQRIEVNISSNEPASLQLLVSAMFLTAHTASIEIIPMIDNNVTRLFGPSHVRVNSLVSESRCIQWIIKDVPAGSHNLTVLAKTDQGNGSIAFLSLVARSLPAIENIPENEVVTPIYLQWWFWAIIITCSVLISSPLTIKHYLKYRRSRIRLSFTQELEEDFARRGKKVIEWNNKYGVELHPSDNKEEIMKRMGIQDKN